jgi:hypothetical protein
MAVSLTGARMSMSTLRRSLVVVVAACVLGFYVYGPAVTPVMRAAAVSSCNELAGGSFRSHHLEWQVSVRPHWSCWDLRDPGEPPVDMGWWVSPRR